MNKPTHAYLLPSNYDHRGCYPENRASNFVTKLIEPTILPHGDWFAKLVDISYPSTWKNLEKDYQIDLKIYVQGTYLTESDSVITVPAGYYKTVEDLLIYVGWQVDKKLIELKVLNRLYCTYDDRTDVSKLTTYGCVIALSCPERDNPFQIMGFEHDIAVDMGALRSIFHGPRHVTKEQRAMVDKSGRFLKEFIEAHPKSTYIVYGGTDLTSSKASSLKSFQHMQVRCDFTNEINYANTKAPILAVVPIHEPKHNERVMFGAPEQVWLPVTKERIDTIRILLTDEKGNEIQFTRGNVLVRFIITQKARWL